MLSLHAEHGQGRAQKPELSGNGHVAGGSGGSRGSFGAVLMDVQAGSGWGLALSWSPSGQPLNLAKACVFLLLSHAWKECAHQLALPWGTRHLISPELAGKDV